MRNLLSTVVWILAAWASVAQANNMNVVGSSEFVAQGKPGFIKIHGQGSGLKGELVVAGDKVSGELSFPISGLTTGVSLRDKHMKDEFLEMDKYPEAKLTLKDVKLPSRPTVEGFKQSKVPFTGTFTCHGVSHPMSGTIDLATKGGKTTGEAQFEVKISEYGFRKPEYLGMKVEDTVQVSAHIETKN